MGLHLQNNASIEDFHSLPDNQRQYIELKYGDKSKSTDVELAKIIGVNAASISRWKQDTRYKAGLRGYNAHYLEKQIPKALENLVQLMNSESETVRYSATKDFLDRTGYKFVERQDHNLSGLVTILDDVPDDDDD